MDILKRLEEFKNPGMEFRGAPFWSLNSRLEPEEMRRQIRVMHQMGMGGFFMHSRVGLDTPYLSDEWFECIEACIDEAGKLGMAAWLYDEDRWPSGAAGGIVSSEDKHRMKFLSCEIVPPGVPETPERFTLAYYAGRVEGRYLLSYRRLAAGEEPGAEEKKLRVFWGYKEKESWFNNESYIDTMNPETIQRFIESTHECYRQRVGKHFGGIVPGVFTDEPCYCHGSVPDRLPWSSVFMETFQRRHGYDLLENAPELFFFNRDDSTAAIRIDFHDTAASLLADSFSGIIGKWCADNNLQFTGHVLHEDKLDTQTVYNGNPMRFYEYMQTPGIDVLTEHWNVFNTAKQCSSVARQMGRQRRLTEIYGCTGWDFPFAGHKALGDWQYALGINLRCHHLFWYSMAAQAKRDYPASIAEHSPWYKNYRVVEDYFARLGALTATDEEVRDLLVIHPIESAWSLMVRKATVAGGEALPDMTAPGRKSMTSFGSEELHSLDRRFQTLTNKLLGAHLDFDFGEEQMMARYADAGTAGVLRVGKAEYRAVLIPHLRTIRSSTLKLLQDFVCSGGRVFYLGSAPERVDGRVSGDARKIFKNSFTKVSAGTMVDELGRVCRRVSVAAPGGVEAAPVLYRLGKSEDAVSLFVCNTGMKFTNKVQRAKAVRERNLRFPHLDITVDVPENGAVYEASLADGTLHQIKYKYGKKGYRFTAGLPELGARMFIITSRPLDAEKNRRETAELSVRRMALPQKGWSYLLDEPNVLVLDYCRYGVNGNSPGEKKFFIEVDHELRDMLGAQRRGGRMVQTWVRRLRGERNDRTLDLELEYSFVCQSLPQRDCRLVVENPEFYSFELNGAKLEAEPAGCWICRDLPAIKLPVDRMKCGTNTLRLRCKYSPEMPGLESLFILGDFGVSRNDEIIPAPAALDCRDVVDQGMPYYSGNLVMRHTFDGGSLKGGRAMLRLASDGWRGSLLGVKINGGREIMLPWPPYTADLTPYIRSGENVLEVIIYGYRRNSFGPFYHEAVSPVWVGAEQLECCNTGGVKNLVPFGLLKAPVIEFFASGGKKSQRSRK